jgi:methionyl-tRNA synthetase
MAQRAHVNSIDAIRDVRAALIRFVDEARNALGATDVQINRNLNWILQEQPAYWKMEIKRRQQALSEARAALHRKRLQARPGSAVQDTEEKELLRKAEHRLEEAEQKLEKVKKWAPVFQHAVNEYFGRSRPFGDYLSGDLQRSIEVLDRMITALDAYVAMAPPSMPNLTPESGTTPGTTPMAAPSAAPGSASSESAPAEPPAEPAPTGAAAASEEDGPPTEEPRTQAKA